MILSTQQHLVADNIAADLHAGGVCIFKVGLQSGSDEIVAQVVNLVSAEYREICIFGRDYKHAMHIGNTWDRRSDVQYQKWPEQCVGHNVLIVMPDAFNTKHSYGTYLLARARGHHVIAYGSYGPEYERVRDWPTEVENVIESVISYNTWDLNPDFDKDAMKLKFPDSFDKDFGKF